MPLFPSWLKLSVFYFRNFWKSFDLGEYGGGYSLGEKEVLLLSSHYSESFPNWKVSDSIVTRLTEFPLTFSTLTITRDSHPYLVPTCSNSPGGTKRISTDITTNAHHHQPSRQFQYFSETLIDTLRVPFPGWGAIGLWELEGEIINLRWNS